MAENVGFISTRFAGQDGVSLESAKWAEVLWDFRHVSYWYGGKLDRDPGVSLCVPEAFFGHPEVEWINERVWGSRVRLSLVVRRINSMAQYLKETLYEFVDSYSLSFLVIENAVTIPMHIPLGVAITEFLYETGIPAIAHHHDFYWERDRFSINAVSDYLDASFPPRVPGMQHVVINEAAQEQLSWRKGVPSMLVPNVLNFEEPPPPPDEYAADVREEIGLEPDDIMILQPTRVIPRKGIEHAIHLVEMLGDSRYKLIISHSAEDEGTEYCSLLQELARESGVDLRIIATRIGEFRQRDEDGNKIYTLADLYPNADMVTYPSLYEGFGNAFLEAIYYRIPVVVNRYATFTRDIEPKGFDVPVMNGFVTRDIVEQVRHIMEDREAREKMVDRNYELARMFYSYSVLKNRLRTLITNVTGMT